MPVTLGNQGRRILTPRGRVLLRSSGTCACCPRPCSIDFWTFAIRRTSDPQCRNQPTDGFLGQHAVSPSTWAEDFVRWQPDALGRLPLCSGNDPVGAYLSATWDQWSELWQHQLLLISSSGAVVSFEAWTPNACPPTNPEDWFDSSGGLWGQFKITQIGTQ